MLLIRYPVWKATTLGIPSLQMRSVAFVLTYHIMDCKRPILLEQNYTIFHKSGLLLYIFSLLLRVCYRIKSVLENFNAQLTQLERFYSNTGSEKKISLPSYFFSFKSCCWYYHLHCAVATNAETDSGNISSHFSLNHTTSLECWEFAGFGEAKACILKGLKGKCSTNAKLELGTVVTQQMNGTVHNKQAERGSLNSKYPLEKR